MPDEIVEPVAETTPEEKVETPLVEETPPTEPVTPAETPEQIQEKKHKSAQRRIDALTREKHDAQREAEYWKGKVSGVEPAPQRDTQPFGKPTPENFTTVEEYVDALTDWKLQTRDAEVAEVNARTEREQTYNKTVSDFQPQLEKARAKYEDYDEVVNQPIFTPSVSMALLDSEYGAEIAYYLGTHPVEATRLNGLPPLRMLRELGKMEVRFASTTQPKHVSAAPSPITPVKGSSPVRKDVTKMSAQEYYEAKQAGLL